MRDYSSKTKAENDGGKPTALTSGLQSRSSSVHTYTHTPTQKSAFTMYPEPCSGDSRALLMKGSAMALRGFFKFSCVS